MTSVDKVKAICKEKKIPISRVEKDLGYANGYIGQLRKGVFPSDRLMEIAKYFDVSPEYLAGESQTKEKSPTPEGMELTKESIQMLLDRMSAEDLSALIADAASELAKRNAK